MAWLDGRSCVSWKSLENNLVHPRRLEDIWFSGIKDKYYMLHCGPIIANTIKHFRIVERDLRGNLNCHKDVPLWHNMNVQIGNKPLDFKPWSLKGINVVGDLYDGNGMFSYQDLKDRFDLQDSSFFYYLQIRSALKAHSVPLRAKPPMHPLINWIKSLSCRGFVSNYLDNKRLYRWSEHSWETSVWRMTTFLGTMCGWTSFSPPRTQTTNLFTLKCVTDSIIHLSRGFARTDTKSVWMLLYVLQ